jgi:DNA-binding NarL/FixJ family response regulator
MVRGSTREAAMSGSARRGHGQDVAAHALDTSSWPQPPRDLELSLLRIDGEELAVLSHPVDEPVPLEGLTEAERQVTADVVDGLSNAQIAMRRGTTPRTVAKQVASIFGKLGIGSRRQLVAMRKRTAGSDRER